MIWMVLVGVGLLLAGFLAGLALRPRDVRRDVRDLEDKVKRAQNSRDRLHDVLGQVIDVNLELLNERGAAQQRADSAEDEILRLNEARGSDAEREIHLLERLEDSETSLRRVRERVDDVLGSLGTWQAMVSRGEYEMRHLTGDLDGLVRQLTVSEQQTVTGGDRS